MIRGSDGYDYEDLTQRLLGQPLKNSRNDRIRALRQGAVKEDVVRLYAQAYDEAAQWPTADGQPFGNCHQAGLNAIYSRLAYKP